MLPFPPAEGEGTFGGTKVVKLGVGPRVPHASRRDATSSAAAARLSCQGGGRVLGAHDGVDVLKHEAF